MHNSFFENFTATKFTEPSFYENLSSACSYKVSELMTFSILFSIRFLEQGYMKLVSSLCNFWIHNVKIRNI